MGDVASEEEDEEGVSSAKSIHWSAENWCRRLLMVKDSSATTRLGFLPWLWMNWGGDEERMYGDWGVFFFSLKMG